MSWIALCGRVFRHTLGTAERMSPRTPPLKEKWGAVEQRPGTVSGSEPTSRTLYLDRLRRKKYRIFSESLPECNQEN